MAEQFAFLSVAPANTRDIGLLVSKLHDMEVNLIATKGTGNTIRAYAKEEGLGLEVIDSLEFLDDAELVAEVAHMGERQRRERIANRLGERLWLPRHTLNELGQHAIDFTYINLLPPEPSAPDILGYNGVKVDKGGMLMIQASMEGGKDTITLPRQIPAFINDLDIYGALLPTPEHARAERDQANYEYLSIYALNALASATVRS